jgi:hypothetical protein
MATKNVRPWGPTYYVNNWPQCASRVPSKVVSILHMYVHAQWCGNNGQGRSLITFIRYSQFKSQIYTNSTQRETPAFIPNKLADPVGWGGADPIWVKTRISNKQFYARTENWRETTKNKEKCKINEHDKIIQYYPQWHRDIAAGSHPFDPDPARVRDRCQSWMD